ncbi:MAG: hypothetical protein ACOYNC_15370 [Bacteroidales bacterium]
MINLGHGVFSNQTFTFSGTAWELNEQVMFDSVMKIPVFIFRAIGTIELVGKSTLIPGVWNTDFSFTSRTVTLQTENPEIIKSLGFTNCGFKTGVTVDVPDEGCGGFLNGVKNCPVEYDLILIKGDDLFLGDRPFTNNLCKSELRSNRLRSYSHKRVQTVKIN